MTIARRPAIVGFTVLVAVTGVAAITDRGGSTAAVLGPGPVTVTLDINYSRFVPDRIAVKPGTRVTFVVRNHDPINHELIVGGPDVHARHEKGTEARHGPIPGEVSVGPGETRRTTFVFGPPGDVLFACHLPRHFDYGMHGTVHVMNLRQ